MNAFIGFRLGPLIVDLDRGEVVGEHGASGLTPRAEDLLLLLSRRAGTLVTRDDILETVWAGRVVEDSAISHCVWQIRRVIGDAGKDILQTRPKRGYVLVVDDSAWIRAEAGGEVVGAEDATPTTAATPLVEPQSEQADSGLSASGQGAAGDAAGLDAAEPAAAEPEDLPPPDRTTRPVGRLVAGIVLALVLVGSALAWWRSQRIEYRPGVEASVAVLASPSLGWLRETLLRRVIERAHLHGIEVVVFRGELSEHPFAGPHLQVKIENEDPKRLEATLTLTQGRARVEERYRGTADGLSDALQRLLAMHGADATRKPSRADDAYVTGRLAEARFSRASALLEYRRALGIEPAMQDARIAMVGLLFQLGRAEDARDAAAELVPLDAIDPVRRCRIERLLARIAAERLGPKPCARAAMLLRLERLQLREALRDIERMEGVAAAASEWLEQQDALVLVLLRLQELERARYEIERAGAIARRAGWPHAALNLEGHLASVHMHRAERRAAADAQRRVAAGFTALGDSTWAAHSLIWVQRTEPIVPGPKLAQRRIELRRIADQSHAAGNLRSEIEALLLLARMSRDRPEVWDALMERARARIREARLDGGNSLHPYFVVGEMVAARRFSEALSELARLERVPKPHPRGLGWTLNLRTELHFWRDELDLAVNAIDAMEREGMDTSASPNPCFIAWVLIEADRSRRANAYLERCNDGKRGTEQTDFGLVATARRLELDGTPERAWPLLRPRLDALLAIREPSRQEAEALALIARHAARLPGAEPARLRAAAAAVDRVAALEGAGPTLRLGGVLLRETICRAERSDRPCRESTEDAAWRRQERFADRLLASATAGG